MISFDFSIAFSMLRFEIWPSFWINWDAAKFEEGKGSMHKRGRDSQHM
jgi:hypothetical protein